MVKRQVGVTKSRHGQQGLLSKIEMNPANRHGRQRHQPTRSDWPDARDPQDIGSRRRGVRGARDHRRCNFGKREMPKTISPPLDLCALARTSRLLWQHLTLVALAVSRAACDACFPRCRSSALPEWLTLFASPSAWRPSAYRMLRFLLFRPSTASLPGSAFYPYGQHISRCKPRHSSFCTRMKVRDVQHRSAPLICFILGTAPGCTSYCLSGTGRPTLSSQSTDANRL